MAHTKAGGSTSLGRDSISKRLGIKKFGGQQVKSGNIIVRQRGTKFRASRGTRMGHDNTIFAVQSGKVKFVCKKNTNFTGSLQRIQLVLVE